MKGYFTEKDDNFISQQQEAQAQNFSEMYPELHLMRSCLLPQVDEGFPDKKTLRKKYMRRPLLICLLISVVVGIIGFISDLEIDFFFICFGISLGISIYLGFIITLLAWNDKMSLIRNSELSKATDYFHLISGRQGKDFRVKQHIDNVFLIVVKNKKFGVWGFHDAKYLIQPEYDYLNWSVKGKVLNAKLNGESFDMTIEGSRLY